MNADILKISVDIVKSPVAYICNLSIIQGVCPEELKTANVLPLYKAEDPMLFNNYRPVSLLTVLPKVFEKIMYNRLLNFLDTYNILFKNQFGFRKKSFNLYGHDVIDGGDNKISGKWRICNWRLFRFLKGLRHSGSWYIFKKITSLWNTWKCSPMVWKLSEK